MFEAVKGRLSSTREEPSQYSGQVYLVSVTQGPWFKFCKFAGRGSRTCVRPGRDVSRKRG